MNERIYDIEKQAWEFVDKTWNWANANNPSQATLFKAKFAELIVRECIKQCQSNDCDVDRYSDEYDNGVHFGVQECVQSLKQHFGVE